MQLQDVSLIPPSLSLEAVTGVSTWPQSEMPAPVPGNPEVGINFIGENQKGTAGRGRQKKRHDNLRQFTTFCDIL